MKLQLLSIDPVSIILRSFKIFRTSFTRCHHVSPACSSRSTAAPSQWPRPKWRSARTARLQRWPRRRRQRRRPSSSSRRCPHRLTTWFTVVPGREHGKCETIYGTDASLWKALNCKWLWEFFFFLRRLMHLSDFQWMEPDWKPCLPVAKSPPARARGPQMAGSETPVRCFSFSLHVMWWIYDDICIQRNSSFLR